ncbi:MAG: hypothetical protein PHI41_10110 [Erysipelotrichaceae bacterium]|nr:hypothetical protein [Erysipelotrichaceae bacterium]
MKKIRWEALSMSKKVKVAVAILMLAAVGIGTYSWNAGNKDYLVIPEQEVVKAVELGNPVSTNVLDYIEQQGLSEKRITDISANSTVEVNTPTDKEYPDLGEYTVTINYQDEHETVLVNVVDTTKPSVKVGEITLDFGTDVSKFDFNKYVTVDDLSKTTTTFDYSGIDTGKAGKYTLKVSVKDTSDNETTGEYSVTVKEKVVAQAKESSTSNSTSSGSGTSSSTKKSTTSSSSSSSSGNNATTKESATSSSGSSSSSSQSSDSNTTDESNSSSNTIIFEGEKVAEGRYNESNTWEEYETDQAWPDGWD